MSLDDEHDGWFYSWTGSCGGKKYISYLQGTERKFLGPLARQLSAILAELSLFCSPSTETNPETEFIDLIFLYSKNQAKNINTHYEKMRNVFL